MGFGRFWMGFGIARSSPNTIRFDLGRSFQTSIRFYFFVSVPETIYFHLPAHFLPNRICRRAIGWCTHPPLNCLPSPHGPLWRPILSPSLLNLLPFPSPAGPNLALTPLAYQVSRAFGHMMLAGSNACRLHTGTKSKDF